METQTNPVKNSSAALAFFMSAAAWVDSAAELENQPAEIAEPCAA